MLLLNPEAIDFADDRLHAVASRAYYLDLGRLEPLQDQRNTPFTPAVHAYPAGLATLGIEPLVAPGESSVVLRSDMNRLLKCFAQRV
jgi:aspartate aminotransferase-like enzyme